MPRTSAAAIAASPRARPARGRWTMVEAPSGGPPSQRFPRDAAILPHLGVLSTTPGGSIMRAHGRHPGRRNFGRRRARKKVVALEDYMDPEAKVGGASGAPDPGRRLEERELREHYFEALEQLSEKHRTVFLLHTVEGMAYKEIASSLEISIGT